MSDVERPDRNMRVSRTTDCVETELDAEMWWMPLSQPDEGNQYGYNASLVEQ
jgi:hypothetical protein